MDSQKSLSEPTPPDSLPVIKKNPGLVLPGVSRVSVSELDAE